MLLTFETRSAKQTGQHTTERKTTTTATTKVEKDASKHLLIPSRFLLLGSSAHERFSKGSPKIPILSINPVERI
jgi:hypothetical protein